MFDVGTPSGKKPCNNESPMLSPSTSKACNSESPTSTSPCRAPFNNEPRSAMLCRGRDEGSQCTKKLNSSSKNANPQIKKRKTKQKERDVSCDKLLLGSLPCLPVRYHHTTIQPNFYYIF